MQYYCKCTQSLTMRKLYLVGHKQNHRILMSMKQHLLLHIGNVISTTDALQHQYLRWTLTSYRAQTLIYTGLDNTSIGVSLNKTNKARGLQHSLIRIHKALTIDTCKIRGHLLPPPPKVPKVMSPNHGTHDLHIRNTVVLMKSLITYICQWSTDGKELQFNLLLL